MLLFVRRRQSGGGAASIPTECLFVESAGGAHTSGRTLGGLLSQGLLLREGQRKGAKQHVREPQRQEESLEGTLSPREGRGRQHWEVV